MPTPKGRTNNPNGRPPKAKSLSTMLEKALARTRDVGDRRVSGKQIVTEMIDRALTTGRVRFPEDTEESILSVKDWIDFVKWAYERVDGKPPQPLTGDSDSPLKIAVEYVNDPYSVTNLAQSASEHTPEPEQV